MSLLFPHLRPRAGRGGALLTGALLAAACAGRPGPSPGAAAVATAAEPGAAAPAGGAARVERRVGLMGTVLELAVDAPDRATALAASEAAVRALEAAERRLSTWTDASELARLNAAPVGEPVELSAALAAELAAARRWRDATGGAFDPAVGGLVRAWDLRGAGRVPTPAERAAALVPCGLDALVLDGRVAVRRDARLCLEEGAFGKGAGLDAALAALRAAGATSAVLDLGGQVAILPAPPQGAAAQGAVGSGVAAPLVFAVADPRDRSRAAARVRVDRGSLATTGNSERAVVVDGVAYGHVLDPRTGRPASGRGSTTVWATGPGAALAADCLSTGLFVLGPDAALAWAEEHAEVEVLVLEPTAGGDLSLRASSGLADRVTAPAPDVSHTP